MGPTPGVGGRGRVSSVEERRPCKTEATGSSPVPGFARRPKGKVEGHILCTSSAGGRRASAG